MTATGSPTGVIVRASAGTGKTHCLAVRCLELLAAGESLDGILATTFTRKAAGEIRARILSLLADADAGSAKTLELLAKEIPGFTRDRARELLVHAVARLHRMQIMTIDALAARMASMLGLEIGLTPGWRVIDDLEDQDMRLRALDRVLVRGGLPAMLPLLHDLHAGAMKASIHRTVLEFVSAGERAWRACAGDMSLWEKVPELPGQLAGDALAQAVQVLADTVCTVKKKNGEPNANWTKAHASAIESAKAGTWDDFLEARIVQAAEGVIYYGSEMPAGMRAAYMPVRDHAAAVLVHQHRVRAKATADLIGRFLPQYEAMKQESSQLCFDDVPRMLRRADEADFGSVYFRMDTRFRHILLDEFQDTSSDQFALLAPMVDEVVAGSEDRRSVLIVGDPKQSLYSWRNAAPGLMDVVERQWPGKFKTETLRASWRSSPAILGAVNEVFGSLESNPVLAGSSGAADMARMFDEHTAMFPDRPGEAVVREIGEPTPRSDEEADAPDWALAAADLVEQIHTRTPDATIGVLTRKGKTAGRIIGVLRGRNIAASAERGTALGDTPAIAAFASVLTLIDHPGHLQAAFHASQTPVGRALGVPDHTDRARIAQVASHLRRTIFAEGVAPMCVRVMKACAADMDTRAARRFEQLIEMCEAFDREPSIRLDVLSRQIWSVPVEDPSASLVRVMTIHAAKGLEFDAVILPELGDLWAVRSPDVLVDQPDPLAPPRAVSPYAKAVVRRVSPELQRLYQATRERRIMDELCALYVGMTRAKSRLEMLIPPPKKSSRESDDGPVSGAAVIRAALAPEVAAGDGQVVWCLRHGEATRSTSDAPGKVVPIATNASITPPRFAVRSGPRSPWRTDRKSPSTIAGHARTAFADRVDLTGAGRYGELMHAWFARMQWIEDGAPARDVLVADAAAAGMEPVRIDGAIKQFHAALAHRGIADALSRARSEAREPGANLEVRAELPFLVRSRTGAHTTLVSGRMDRITIAWKDGRAHWIEIVDFKTDSYDASNPEWVAHRVEAHRSQMEAYRAAAATMLGLGPEQVRIALVFTSMPAIAWIDAR